MARHGRAAMAKKTTVSISEWAKHLRRYGKRVFWKKDSAAAKLAAKKGDAA